MMRLARQTLQNRRAVVCALALMGVFQFYRTAYFSLHVCEPQRFGHFHMREFSLQRRPLSEFMDVDESSPGYCRFDTCRDCGHFPHAAQVLYSCFSYWNNQSPDTPRILVTTLTEEHPRFTPITFFAQGLVSELVRKFKLHVVSNHTGGAKPKVNCDIFDALPYAMVDPVADTHALRDLLVPNHTIQPANCGMPRIRILNRLVPFRRITNVDSLALFLSSNRPWPTVTIHTFEFASYHRQFRFMANTDILISPHGAQLTSLITMPTCGAVLELFPTNYYIPNFFGSLADAAGVRHYAAYENTTTPGDLPWQIVSSNFEERSAARNVRLCPDPSSILPMLETMVENWQLCCGAEGG